MAEVPGVLRRLGAALRAGKREATLFLLLFLAATLGFALGYLASDARNHPPIIIEKRFP